MTEALPIEISIEQYEESFTDLTTALDYFFEQLKLYHPVEAYLVQIGKEENYKAIFNQKPKINKGGKKISIIIETKMSLSVKLSKKE